MLTKTKIPIAVLISGNGSNLQAIIDYAKKQHDCCYEVNLVISNKQDAYGLQRAIQANICNQTVEHNAYKNREHFENAMLKILKEHNIEFIVLAGFMRILSSVFIEHYVGRILNIHPSLLPKYPGLNTHKKALEAGDKQHGISIHFVTNQLDGGPIIFQDKTTIDSTDTVFSLQKKIHQLEHNSYPKIINEAITTITRWNIEV